jgi:hypothetical protein
VALFTDVLETGHWQGDFGVHFDFALKPVFRRELRSRGGRLSACPTFLHLTGQTAP